MNAPTLKTRLAQFEIHPGHPARNTRTLLDALTRARADGIELLVCPEMAIPGYLLGDAWERPAFLRECEACGETIRDAARGITVVFGNVAMDWSRRNEDGRVRKYNALFVTEEGRFIGPEDSPYPFCIKTLMPNYRQFDDSRHFFDLRKLAFELQRPLESLLRAVPAARARLGCVLCEDAWDMDYGVSPLALLARDPAVQVFINASASPFTVNKNHKRHRVFHAHAARLGRPLIYSNHTGIQNNGKTVYTFDGRSCVYLPDGGYHELEAPFADGELTLTLPLRGDANTADSGPAPPVPDDDTALIHRALTYGTRRMMDTCRIGRIVIGASGGIDSAVIAALYAAILPPEDILLVNMPSRYNSDLTRGLARELADTLGCCYADIPVEDGVALTVRQIDGLTLTRRGKPDRTLRLDTAALENVQARDRSGRILAAAASAFGGAFTCNANKSEMTVGYTTLYGDLGGWLAAIGDLWKTQVYDLAREINAHGGDIIPQGSIDVVPSAELSAEQDITADKGDPLVYPYHDRLFASWIERWDRASPEDILDWYAAGTLERELGFAGRIADLFPDAAIFCADLERWWNLYQGIGVAKRIQAPPVLAVKRRAFGFDHREAQMPPHYTARYSERKRALAGR